MKKFGRMALVVLGLGFVLGVRPAAAENAREYTYVFAHYMSWFETPEINRAWRLWNWNVPPHRHDPDRIFEDGRRDIAAHDYPLIGPYASSDEAVVEYHILLAKAAGIDGFVVNWYGFRDEHDRPRPEDAGFRALLKAAERLHFYVCLDLDDKCLFPPYTHASDRESSVGLGSDMLRRIAKEYASSPAYFRLDGQPVLTNFGWGPPFSAGENATSLSPEEWGEMFAGEGMPAFLFIADHQWYWDRDIFHTGFLDVARSIYPWVTGEAAPRLKFYADSQRAVETKRMAFISGEACPGFDNEGTWGWGGGRTVINRDDGALYRRTWGESLDAKARWIQIITWNDFAEGSTIEPTREYGYRYLELTAQYTQWLGHPHVDAKALKLPLAIYTARLALRRQARTQVPRLKTGALGALQSELNQAVAQFVQGDYPACRDRLKNVEKALGPAQQQEGEADNAVRLTLSPPAAEIHPGERQTFTVELENPGADVQTGELALDSGGDWPRAWVAPERARVQLKPHARLSQTFVLTVPPEASTQTALVEARLRTGEGWRRSRTARLQIAPFNFHMSLQGHRLLAAGKTEVIRLRLQARQKSEDQGTLTLEAPAGWSVEPRQADYRLPAQGAAEVLFKLTIPRPGAGQVHIRMQSNVLGAQQLQGTFQVLQPGEVALIREDLNNDGCVGFVLGNSQIEVHVTAGLGGRILAMFNPATGHNVLYTPYPELAMLEGKGGKDWIEYGGLSDIFPQAWPGEIWNNVWESRVEENASSKTLIMTGRSPEGLTLTRRLKLEAGNPALQAEYDFCNPGQKPCSGVVWGNHPDLAPGGENQAQPWDALLVPTSKGVVREAFAASRTKSDYLPAAGWCAALDTRTGEYFAQRFSCPEGTQIGAWKDERFFTLEINLPAFRLAPQEHKKIKVDYLVGSGNWAERLGLKDSDKISK